MSVLHSAIVLLFNCKITISGLSYSSYKAIESSKDSFSAYKPF